MQKICVIGPGRAGGAFAIALSKKGAKVSSLVARSPESVRLVADAIDPRPEVFSAEEIRSASADVYLITVNDERIQSVANALAGSIDPEGKTVLHVSGSRSSSVLSRLSAAGARTGSLHPLVSISNPQIGSRRFEGAYFCVEGDPEGVAVARELAETLGGIPFEIHTEKKPLYHASAVVACGHLVALIDTAVEALTLCGLSGADAMRVLLPLIASTVDNLKTQTPPEALTGTFARADVETFEAHLSALAGNDLDEFLEIYLLLGLRSLKLAEEHGADPRAVAEIRSGIESITKRSGG
ncbi:MAG TPA: DUF2520 domain-containing protein [Aridibacter sp.]|nr:DUF2520 domain-containing protein [Aridibacter sp.]